MRKYCVFCKGSRRITDYPVLKYSCCETCYDEFVYPARFEAFMYSIAPCFPDSDSNIEDVINEKLEHIGSLNWRKNFQAMCNASKVPEDVINLFSEATIRNTRLVSFGEIHNDLVSK